MSKHRLSPPPLPPPKRIHLTSDVLYSSPATFESLSEELILHIFSYLEWKTLCVAQAINRSWSRLAADNELWKNLYLHAFGRSRLRGPRGFVGPTDDREVISLPAKTLFRISANWMNGRCAVQHLRPRMQASEFPSKTHILLAGSLIVTATSQSSSSPVICLRTLTGEEHTLACPTAYSENITAIVLDQGAPSNRRIRLAAFLSSGEFRVFCVNHDLPSSSYAELAYTPSRRSNRTCPIIHAAYHHPLLITLSETFTISVYDLSSGSAVLMQTLGSFTSFPPTSLVLSRSSTSTYKLVIAYAIPVYPAHWTVGATELMIAGPASISELPQSSSLLISEPHTPMTIIHTRTTRALDVPQGWVDERKLSAMREQWTRKVASVADTQTDGKWVVLAPDDPSLRSSLPSSSPSGPPPSKFSGTSLYSFTGLQLYRLSFPSLTSVSSATPKLTFVRTLHGQLGPVAALSLSDGRCVSIGVNGSIWVWDLESTLGTEIAGPSFDVDRTLVDAKRGIVFDERRIVTSTNEHVVERRFDI